MQRSCAVIPAYNEESKIFSVIKQLKNYRNIDIIVVDDGSEDRTAELVKSEGVILLRHPVNKGKGCALRNAFRAALDEGYEYIITLDGDGQHSPEELPRFIDSASESGADIVSGNRMLQPKGMPPSRRFINRLFSRIVSCAAGQKVPDALCGYRLIKRHVLESVDLSCERFDIVPEILIKASRKGFKIMSIKIESIYADEISHIRPLRDGFMFFRLIFLSFLQRKIDL